MFNPQGLKLLERTHIHTHTLTVESSSEAHRGLCVRSASAEEDTPG